MGAHVVRPSPCGACCGGICGKAHHCGTMQASSPTNHVQRSQHTARQNSSAVAFTPILYKGKYAFQHAEKKSDLYFPVNRALHFYVMLTKPAKTGELNASCRAAFESNIILLWQHRTIPALRLKHRSGSCGTASALPKSSIICAFGLASAAPRSPYRHLELCGIALYVSANCRGRCPHRPANPPLHRTFPRFLAIITNMV